MFRGTRILGLSPFLSFALSLFVSVQSRSQSPPSGQALEHSSWESKARLHQRLKSAPGQFVFGEHDIEFRPVKGSSLRWSFVEIKTINLQTSRRLTLTTYENRSWHRGGDRQFRFALAAPMPPNVAAELVRGLGKPAVNGDPDPQAASFATIPARHRTRTGGGNGVLRFRDYGVDYVTSDGRGSRSWRWVDIETLANPDPYQLRVGAYLETFDFELKQPLSPTLFDRLWNRVYVRGLNVDQTQGGQQHAEH
jgi:hypothetical protein